ncbi:uncharacterized protein NPIL_646961 [Nephila pilipes]|uniref:DUF6570 domain-containing protein n=1 Tax=Nephila pilipes TaxID=299642 RepID=A0A8X6PE22_NEPPI|nr:uncharacterized protein NPIL_631341 [Nephila pilipes]GFT65999.1 uncharacterized protein NPIL_454201 [Nephila pilipes]GFT92737.1 uncharacterized protein NPIL_376311 [Nephila pilipes]GFU28104.1 uncharacterized protein NPIL_646961 [Nephila pilipes]
MSLSNLDVQRIIEIVVKALCAVYSLCLASSHDRKLYGIPLMRFIFPNAILTRRQNNAVHIASVRANETPEVSATRRQINAVQTATARVNETQEQVATRRQNNSVQTAVARASVSAEEQEEMLQIRRNARAQRLASVAEFYNYMNTFCDQICQICHQLCYPNQVVKFNNSTPKEYLPIDEKELLVCNREIPNEILDLIQPELRLLQRIIPYVKLIKYGSRFGQYGFKGKSNLSALYMFELSETLPDMLSRSSENAAAFIVTETLDNLNHSRDHTISRDLVYAALRWLVKYNRLYKDVAINHLLD